MKLKDVIIFLMGTFFIYGCRPYERIGRYKYQTKTTKVFTGDYGGIVHEIKSFYFKGKNQGGGIIKAQLGFNPTVDTSFATGFSEIDNANKQLIFREYYFYGYAKFGKRDSVVRIFKQEPGGALKLVLYREYYNGNFKDAELIK